uniref:Uncharacterized protein n=1 Tax=Rhizophora mucronata TaxID=61149 RepID=A0A2P2QVZ3_RHIMU
MSINVDLFTFWLAIPLHPLFFFVACFFFSFFLWWSCWYCLIAMFKTKC